MKTESTIGKLKSEVTEIQDYHRQASVGTISESLQEREVDTRRVRQSIKDHVYAVSDDQGQLLEHYRYTAFGQTENKLGGRAINNPVLWNSRRYDERTDLYYYKYIHYKADIVRWLGRDPAEEWGGYNLYGFVGNSPMAMRDIIGLAKCCVKEGSFKIPHLNTYDGNYASVTFAMRAEFINDVEQGCCSSCCEFRQDVKFREFQWRGGEDITPEGQPNIYDKIPNRYNYVRDSYERNVGGADYRLLHTGNEILEHFDGPALGRSLVHCLAMDLDRLQNGNTFISTQMAFKAYIYDACNKNAVTDVREFGFRAHGVQPNTEVEHWGLDDTIPSNEDT